MPAASCGVLHLRFEDGTLTIAGGDAALCAPGGLLHGLAVYDERIRRLRASALAYAAILRAVHGQHEYRDDAKAYATLHLREHHAQRLRHYQMQALSAWHDAQRRGVVVLPTGAGKSYVAVQAMLRVQRSTLVMAPTIDLVEQWRADLERRFACNVGQYGGGIKELADITVATYDSAVLFMPHLGNRFGLLVADECHHLPASATRGAAAQCIAPFRLGLTATPERTDGGHAALDELMGRIVHRSSIDELEGRYLATYEAEVIEVPMDSDELRAYGAARQTYLSFVRRHRIDFGSPGGWQEFLGLCARSSEGRAVMAAWREQKRLATASRAKLGVLWQLLGQHRGERCIVFTNDNATAYTIGRQMLLPVLTHHTRGPERRWMLAAFKAGQLRTLVTSKVLNEGVDVPEASVGVVVSGSGSVREHVQRLGRILRPAPGKQALLYELVAAGTGEGHTSQRRRLHAAFDDEQGLFDGEGNA